MSSPVRHKASLRTGCCTFTSITSCLDQRSLQLLLQETETQKRIQIMNYVWINDDKWCFIWVYFYRSQDAGALSSSVQTRGTCSKSQSSTDLKLPNEGFVDKQIHVLIVSNNFLSRISEFCKHHASWAKEQKKNNYLCSTSYWHSAGWLAGRCVYRNCGRVLCSVLALWTLPVRDPEVPHRTGGVLLGRHTYRSLVFVTSTAAVWTGGRWRYEKRFS